MILRLLLVLATFVSMIMVSTAPVLAQSKVDVFSEVCKKAPDSTACKEKTEGKKNNPIYGANGILTKVINLLSIVVGIAAVLAIMVAGLKFITSGSNPQQVTVAREMVLYAVVGLIVAALAQLLIRFVLGKL